MTELGRNAIGLARNRAVTAARRAAGAGSGCAAANGGKSVRHLGKMRLGGAQDQIRAKRRLGPRVQRRMDNGAAMVKLGKTEVEWSGQETTWPSRVVERTARERWSENMRDAAELFAAVTTAKLNRELDERECKRRNALSQTSPGLVLRAGDVGTVVETFGPGEAFLVEFVKNGKAAKGECDWMGVLYPTEIELGTGPEKS
jgi:hypothetical protein